MNIDGITYLYEEQRMYLWENEMTNIIKTLNIPLNLTQLSILKNECKNIKFDLYLNQAFKKPITIRELAHILQQ